MTFRPLAAVLTAVTFVAITYAATTVVPPVAHGGILVGPQVTHRHFAAAPSLVKCAARLGPSFVQFSVYQAHEPRARYCKDVPDVGMATIVIDQGDTELRGMATDVRIIKDIGGAAGVTELLSDAADAPEALDPYTVEHVLPRLYPAGIIEFVHRFDDPGQFHAVVTVKNDHGQVYVAEFPFSVGQSGHGMLLLWGGSATALIAAALFLAWKYEILQRVRARIGHM